MIDKIKNKIFNYTFLILLFLVISGGLVVYKSTYCVTNDLESQTLAFFKDIRTSVEGDEWIIELPSVKLEDLIIYTSSSILGDSYSLNNYLYFFILEKWKKSDLGIDSISNFLFNSEWIDNSHIVLNLNGLSQKYSLKFCNAISVPSNAELRELLLYFNNKVYEICGKNRLNLFFDYEYDVIDSMFLDSQSDSRYIYNVFNNEMLNLLSYDFEKFSLKYSNISFKAVPIDGAAGDYGMNMKPYLLGIYFDDILVCQTIVNFRDYDYLVLENKYDSYKEVIREYIGHNSVDYNIVERNFERTINDELNRVYNFFICENSKYAPQSNLDFKYFDIILNNGKKMSLIVSYADAQSILSYENFSNQYLAEKTLEKLISYVENGENIIVINSLDPSRLLLNYYALADSKVKDFFYMEIIWNYLCSFAKDNNINEDFLHYDAKDKNHVTVSIGPYHKDYTIKYLEKDVDMETLEKVVSRIKDKYEIGGKKLVKKFLNNEIGNGLIYLMRNTDFKVLNVFTDDFNTLSQEFNVDFSYGIFHSGAPVITETPVTLCINIYINNVLVGIKEVEFYSNHFIWLDNSYSSFENYLSNELKINLDKYKILEKRLIDEFETEYAKKQEYYDEYGDIYYYELRNENNDSLEIYAVYTTKKIADKLNSDKLDYSVEDKGKLKISISNNTIDKVLQDLNKSGANYKHYDIDMSELSSNLVKTGDYIEIIDEDNEVTYLYRIAISGDVSGDGNISALDYIKIKNHIMQVGVINEDIYLEAADVNDDDKITALDYVTIKNIIMNGE